MIKEWLVCNNLNDNEVDELLLLINLCMSQNSFQFNKRYYVQNEGTAMGNLLSSFIANFFMSSFEINAKRSMKYFPRIWVRYVDDIFAVFDKNENLDTFCDTINGFHPTIKFTKEIEKDCKLPFLDVNVFRGKNALSFSVYRKPTHTDRYITEDSHHSPAHKRAAFNSMAHRLVNLPLSKDNYEKELKYMYGAAIFNGYSKELIDNTVRKMNFKKNLEIKVYSCKQRTQKTMG